MGNKILMRLEATSNKEIMEKYGCKRQEIGDQVMEEFRPLVPSRLDDHQPVIMQAANSEAQEPSEDVMDDADVAGLAMGWMSKGD